MKKSILFFFFVLGIERGVFSSTIKKCLGCDQTEIMKTNTDRKGKRCTHLSYPSFRCVYSSCYLYQSMIVDPAVENFGEKGVGVTGDHHISGPGLFLVGLMRGASSRRGHFAQADQ
ncbi:hypothetical protein DFH27DRAFT_576705 [Peziza echinospora]|nr:hypothetical protein DFH27DRAFT_576705 [Peziza echinospora]